MRNQARFLPVIRRVTAMRIPIYAGNASFFLLLSVFPILSLLLSLLPYTSLTVEHLLGFCREIVPAWMLQVLEFFVRTIYTSSSAAIVSLSAVLTLWSASKGMLSLLYGLDAVAEVRETRSYLKRRLLCVVYTVGMLAALVLTLGLYVVGRDVLAFLRVHGFALAAVLETVMRHLHLYSLILLTLLFAGIFLALPDTRRRLLHVLPGAAGAACAWVIFSELYSLYVNHIAKASTLYGSLSVLLLMLLWLYSCMSILFYGALANHVLFDWRAKEDGCSDT